MPSSSSNCIIPPDAKPVPFADIQFFPARMHKVEFALWIFLMKLTVALHRCLTTGAGLNDGQTIQ